MDSPAAAAGGGRSEVRPSAPDPALLPSISLPRGGGAIRGIEEKLTVGMATGSAALTVPIGTSAARQGFAPQLALSYDSGAGNGAFGLGWNVAIPAVMRKTSLGLPRYDERDVYVLAGVEDLVPLLVSRDDRWVRDVRTEDDHVVERFRPRVEGGFARIERWRRRASGECHWRTVSGENVTSLYGQTPASRVADPEDPARVFSWLLDLSFDDRGNAIRYEYKAEDTEGVPRRGCEQRRRVGANRYPKSILYGNATPYRPGERLPDRWCFEVVFDYGEHDPSAPTPAEQRPWACRPDPFSSYRSCFEIRTYRLCRRVLMFHRFPRELGAESVVVGSTDLTYSTSTDTPGERAGDDRARPRYSLLGTVTRTGWVRRADGYETRTMPPLELEWEPLAIDRTLRVAEPSAPPDVGGPRRRWLDLDGEGLQGILTEDEGCWQYQENLSAESGRARFAAPREVATKPAAGGLQLSDLGGEGRMCAVRFAPPEAGFYERDEAERWSGFRSFATTASVDWASPNLRFVDLDGDGLADLLLTEDDALTWYPWRWRMEESGCAAGRGRFDPPETVPKPLRDDDGPALVFADGEGSIFLADMCGDGLSDLVRVRNGEISYWPNLGYGRFGRRVAMDGAPLLDFPDAFDPARVRLADIDGSGTADLIYLGADGVGVWFNEAGNRWSAGQRLEQFPALDGLAHIDVIDLLGAGTACLVWSSPLPADSGAPLRYVDLTGGAKPYLLRATANGMGARTSVSYEPSTRFYVRDKLAGTPWLTRLPFPVHVVSRVETSEAVNDTRTVSTYSYHHGYFDPVEREFRGFARVEQLDCETLPRASGTGRFTGTPDVAEEDFALVPAWTRTWYHTGAVIGGEDLAALLDHEYYRGDRDAPRLARSVLPETSAEERREGARALRGRVLREEVYACDDTAESVHPYTTTQHRYRVRRLQPARGGAYGAFYAYELESVSAQYERRPRDPRIAHRLTLAVDDYGNVTESAGVAYPRRTGALAEQRAMPVTATASRFANETGRRSWYRIGLSVQTCTYELTGLPTPDAGVLLDAKTLRDALARAPEIAYEARASEGVVQRRLFAQTRTVYRADDLTKALALGEVESLALVDARYRLDLTPGLLGGTFVQSGKLGAAELAGLLADEGGFVDLDGDGARWAPSARVFYSEDPAHPDAAAARCHFYLPRGTVDPWGNVARVHYDDHDLLVSGTVDAVGNSATAEHNYRVLAPWLITDANRNRSGVRFDALGMVIATAQMGKRLPDGGDEGDHLDTSTAELAPGDDPTTTLAYDLHAFLHPDRGRRSPVWVRTRARVRHRDPETPWLTTYTYSDGLGRVALTKTEAEPGPAPVRDAAGVLVRDAAGDLRLASTDSRWVGSGRVVYDRKGNPIKAYEPFFDSSPAYDDEQDLVMWGVTAIARYDPLGRRIRIDNPNGTYRAVEFDAWGQRQWDENDTVLRSEWFAARSAGQLGPAEREAAARAAAHADTPAASDFDPLGRTFRTVQDNGAGGAYATVLRLDIQGRTRETRDALGRVVLRQRYDMAGRELHRVSADAGARWLLGDAGGQSIVGWDSRGHTVRMGYDALRRPTDLLVARGDGPPRLAERITYGEALADARARNLRAAVHEQRDGAGLGTTLRRDFQGNVIESSRRLLADERGEVDWSRRPALEREAFATGTSYDALNRPTATRTPDGSVTRPAYNQRSLLAGVAVEPGAGAQRGIVEHVAYDARGQRERIEYGNGASTAYTYDPETFRLVRLRTDRSGERGRLQDLRYTYDPVGNVTRLADGARQRSFFDNQVVDPAADYTYDAIYRLVRASGREHVGQAASAPVTWDDAARTAIPLPGDGQAMRNYSEAYTYDEVGNLLALAHTAARGGWTRRYLYEDDGGGTPTATVTGGDAPGAQATGGDAPDAPATGGVAPGAQATGGDAPDAPATGGDAAPVAPDNRLRATSVGGGRERFRYDPHGNVTSMAPLSLMAWDWKDQLSATASQLVNEGAPETTHYRYDAAGRRVSKSTFTRAGRRTARRIYLGALEIYREYRPDGGVALERQTLHVGDGQRLICLLETTTADTAQGAPPPATRVRFQLANSAGSSLLELDHAAAILTYEEYYPYGSTSFRSGRSAAEVSLKRYRYTGKERDSESGLYYHGARYYAPWLGRWISCDPAGLVDGPDPYVYVRGNPVVLRDPSGRQSAPVALSSEADLAADRNDVVLHIRELQRPGAVGDWWGDEVRPHRGDWTHPLSGFEQRYIAAFRDPSTPAILRMREPVDPHHLSDEERQDATRLFGADKSASDLYANYENRRRIVAHYVWTHPATVRVELGLYRLVRDINPIHFALERGWQMGSGQEMFTNAPVSRLGAAAEFFAYLATQYAIGEALRLGRPPAGEPAMASSGPRWNQARAGHIFRNEPGHLTPTTAQGTWEAISEFRAVAADSANLRTDAVRAGIITQRAADQGVQAYTHVGLSGEQTWVAVRNGEIVNAGRNPRGAFR